MKQLHYEIGDHFFDILDLEVFTITEIDVDYVDGSKLLTLRFKSLIGSVHQDIMEDSERRGEIVRIKDPDDGKQLLHLRIKYG